MTSASARQWQRVDYQVPVQLMVRMGGAGTDTVGFADVGLAASRTLLAQAVNLSEGGISVRTSDPLPIGEAVTCSMLLEGRQTSLPGRVRWVKSTDEGLHEGAGIQFDALRDDESGLLRHLVSRATGGDQPVELYFPSMNEPVRARAMTSDGGLYITAALPVLTRDAEVEFQFGGEGPRFLGRIARVAVRERERTPHLEVELAIHAREMPRFRRYTMYGDPAREALEAAALRETEAQSLRDAQAPSMRGSHAPEVPPEPSESQTTTDATTPAIDAPQEPAPVLRLWDPKESPELPAPSVASDPVELPRSSSARVLQAAQLPRALLWMLFGLGAALPFALVAWFAFASTTIRPATPARTASAAKLAAHATRPASSFGAATTGTPAATTAVAATPASAPVTAAILPTAPSAAIEPNVPEVRVEPSATEVQIPILGSGDPVRSMLWAAPLALVVELPNASFAATERSYAVKDGGISRLMLTHSRTGSAVARVFLDAKVAHHDVRVEAGRLIVRIEREATVGPSGQ